jgi:ABC-2 type transport system ATP-binding protein
MPNIIETFSLTKRFSTAESYKALFRVRRNAAFTAVDQVSLQIGEGELFGLLGANGAGKTTLIKILCTLILPSEGRAVIAGRDVVNEAKAIRPLIGLVNTEERSFFWRLSGRQNLEFFASLHGLHGARAGDRITELLKLVGLIEHQHNRFMGYSSGMKQKLAIARGLLSLPPVIFMDEPTRSLDPLSARELRTFIREVLINQLGRTVVLVTHRLEEAEELCDRVAIIKQGKILACGPIAEIKQHVTARQRYQIKVQALPSPALEGLKAIPGVVQLQYKNGVLPVTEIDLTLNDENETLPEVMHYLVTQGGRVQACHAQRLSLEDAFVQLVKGDKDVA